MLTQGTCHILVQSKKAFELGGAFLIIILFLWGGSAQRDFHIQLTPGNSNLPLIRGK